MTPCALEEPQNISLIGQKLTLSENLIERDLSILLPRPLSCIHFHLNHSHQPMAVTADPPSHPDCAPPNVGVVRCRHPHWPSHLGYSCLVGSYDAPLFGPLCLSPLGLSCVPYLFHGLPYACPCPCGCVYGPCPGLSPCLYAPQSPQ